MNEVAVDLSKVIRYVEGAIYFVQKKYDTNEKMYKLKYVNEKDMTKSLKLMKLWKSEDGVKLTAFDAFLKYMSKFKINGVKFYSNESNCFSIFQGYKYNVVNTIHDSLISPFFNMIKEVICDNNEDIYKCVIGWIANIIKHPGLKNETVSILKGLQGVGKNALYEVLCELMSGYSEKNVIDIPELTGNFNSVVENKMIIVLNEVKNCGDDRMANFNALKSMITDKMIRTNEKNQPRRTAENVANFIFITNNAFPVKIELGDRRYVVLQVNEKYKGKFDYFDKFL